MNFRLEEAPNLDRDFFLMTLRKARNGAAGGPSGMTAEHLRVLLHNENDGNLHHETAVDVVKGEIPGPVAEAMRLGQMRALQKPAGGVRGIVVGDILRRLVAKTLAQELSSHFEAATAPFQYALTTRSGCECVAHAVQALTDADPSTTVLSVDGVGAFDMISRSAMLQGLKDAPGCERALSFVLQFYGRPFTYVWEDDCAVVHEITQGEGGEQGDPLMPALYALGQHRALVAVQAILLPSEKLFAFLDDICLVANPRRIAAICAELESALWDHAGISINLGKTQLFNRGGFLPLGCQHILQAGREMTPPVIVWRGDHMLPDHQQGIAVLGTPLGHEEFVKVQAPRTQPPLATHRSRARPAMRVADSGSPWVVGGIREAARRGHLASVSAIVEHHWRA